MFVDIYLAGLAHFITLLINGSIIKWFLQCNKYLRSVQKHYIIMIDMKNSPTYALKYMLLFRVIIMKLGIPHFMNIYECRWDS